MLVNNPEKPPLIHERLAAEFVRSVRGKRSQLAFSRRLRCKSNVVHSWECGRRWPAASRWLRACQRAGCDVRAALTTFYRSEPAWLSEVDVDSPAGIARLLGDLKGNTKLGEVASRSGLSRFAVSRYLKSQAEPRLPDFLRLVDALSARLPDFLAAFVDPESLPSLTKQWRQLQAARRSAYDLPWSHAVLRVLETEQYARAGNHQPGWVAQRLGISSEEEAACLAALEGPELQNATNPTAMMTRGHGTAIKKSSMLSMTCSMGQRNDRNNHDIS
jgi:DNA-binding phage protein